VVCVERRPAGDHRHVVGLGVTRGDKPIEHKSVKDVRRAIKAGTDTFYTVDRITGSRVTVERSRCCGEKTVRSVVATTKTDTLTSLVSCTRLTWFMAK
jgi:hypothetical protein